MNRLGAVCLALAFIAGCQRSGGDAPVSQAPAPAAATPGEGIPWFEGDLQSAFASAAAQNKPVFLYWGAVWCPPCHDLKAHVFSRRDFQEKMRQFVPVYLDGDAPGAQRAASDFQVLGYPTAVVLRADRTEIVRIAGGMDLGRYADVLELALDAVRPLPEVLASLRGDGALQLNDADCRRLAYNGWGLDPRVTDDPRALVESLLLAAQRCPTTSTIERDRLSVMAAGLAASIEREPVVSGRSASSQLRSLLDATDLLLADRARSLRVADALLDLGDDFFVVTRRIYPQRVAPLQQRWYALMDAVELDTNYSDTVRLATAGGRLMAAKALDSQEKIPASVAARARTTLNTFLARNYDAEARSGIVNSASWVLSYLDDDAGLRKLLEGEIRTSRTPYYYMPDLADLEEKAGHKEQALVWLQRAYGESRGPATRFQWGVLYLEGLLRISPQDEPRIRAAAMEVLGELAGPDRIHARALTRLTRVNDGLNKWASETRHKDTLAAIKLRWREICAAVPVADPASRSCPGLLTTGV